MENTMLTIIGIVIGSVITTIGTVVNQLFISRKERIQWENQQAAEKFIWIRNEQKKEKEYLRKIYQNSLRSLSVYIALVDQDEEEDNRSTKLDLITEIHDWVTMLLLRHSGTNLDNVLSSFNNSPDWSNANNLRKEIVELLNREDGFFQNELKNEQGKNEESVDPDVRYITIEVDDDFRKQQLISGIEIQQKYQFEFKLSEMTNHQRELLSELFFQHYKTIPKKISLLIPVFNVHSKQIQMQGRKWKANLNPKVTESLTILGVWEQDFDSSLHEAKQSYESLSK